VAYRGRLASLLEVGTGFHPELTGRENVFLNGSLLGMGGREIARKFDEIVAFSEIERFLDTPVKRYSSGMYIRLAFAVAAHLETESLLVDEVLAVGDVSFQRKCLGKMGDVARSGRTVLFVSHNMGAITRLCGRALWLEQGRTRADGPVNDILAAYLAAGGEESGERTFTTEGEQAPGSEYVRLQAVRIRDHNGRVAASLDVRFPFTIELEYQVLRHAVGLRVGLRLLSHDGTVVLTSTDLDGADEGLVREPGRHVSRCTVPADFLNYGQYFVSVGSDFPLSQVHFALDPALSFQIEATGGTGGHIPDGRTGLLRTRLPWVIETDDRPR
jgi:lipopolysaccharide transport system ATP-binding protein